MDNKNIKEILDKLNKLEYDDIHLIICEVISRREIKLLLDYITNLQEENDYYFKKNNELSTLNTSLRSDRDDYKSRNEKANTLLDEMLERAYIDGEYILYDYSTSELLEVKQALQGEDNENN